MTAVITPANTTARTVEKLGIRRIRDDPFKPKNGGAGPTDFKMRGREMEAVIAQNMMDCDGATIGLDMIHEEAGVGTDEEAPADEDGEGARVGVIRDHARQHPFHHVHHHHHHDWATNQIMDIEHNNRIIKTGPDEIDQPDYDLGDEFVVIHQQGKATHRKPQIPMRHA